MAWSRPHPRAVQHAYQARISRRRILTIGGSAAAALAASGTAAAVLLTRDHPATSDGRPDICH
ncbi:hypothetical protein AB0I51_11625 [Streptomyces sp. NPDC050549]|uniref:hypothetical protein n=1 Tax=Streptomyces sp. NPDC050549 TaxID=3155406 RepID=UPI0034395EEA